MTLNSDYHLKIQAQGRVVIPNRVRLELGVEEGGELILIKDQYGYRLSSRALIAQSLLGSLKKTSGADYTEEFLSERQVEAQTKDW